MSDGFGMVTVIVALAGLVGAVKVLQSRLLMGDETARKTVHMGMGIVCLSFPWLFITARPVWGLAVIALLALGAMRIVPGVRKQLGSVLHNVNRTSAGELYFPIGVAVVFTLAAERRILFLVPVAILTFADAAGALVGKRFGRHRYVTVEGTKSVEGSVSVGVVGCLCTAVPLLFDRHATPEVFVIAVLIGLFCVLVEAISWRGLDNLFLPLASFAQISVYIEEPEGALLMRLAVLAAITLASFAWRRGRWVDCSARLGGALALYFFWTTGGWQWLIGPLLLIASYVRLMPTVPGGAPRHNLIAIICVASSSLVWCVAAALAPEAVWLWPFTISLAAQQTIIAIVRFSQGRPRWGRTAWWTAGVAQGCAVQLTAFGAIDRTATLREIVAGALIVAVAGAGFIAVERRLREPESLRDRWWKQGLTSFAASVAAFSLTCL